MLIYLYIEALLVDEELADQVWEAWDNREINDLGACWLWLWIAVAGYLTGRHADERRNGGGIAGEPDFSGDLVNSTDDEPKYADDYYQPENDCISWAVATRIKKD